jgi:cytidylate kinase
MYRAVALKALRSGVGPDDDDGLTRVANESSIALTRDGRVLLDGEDVTAPIREEKVTSAASVVSTVPGVRRALVRQQREIGRASDCVMEGRDIGTVVFPDADLKVFLVADLEERARRRLLQMERQGLLGESSAADGTEDTSSRASDDVLRGIMEEIGRRDERDSTRDDSPLLKARDAVELDTTGLTIEEQVEAVVEMAFERGAKGGPGDRTVRR